MDDARFDALARRVMAAARPRRSILALLASGGLLLGDVTQDIAAARHHRPHRHRREDPQDINEAITLPPGKTLGCKFAGQLCGALKSGKKKKVARCCPNSSCQRSDGSGNLIPVGKHQRGRCSCDFCFEDPDGDGVCTQKVAPPCAGLNVACNASFACCDPGAGNPAGPCIGDVCTGVGFCSPASIACDIVRPQKGSTRCNAVPDFATQCCKLASMACADDCQCCGSMRCEGGVCVPCVSDGDICPSTCAADTECHLCCAGYCRVTGLCGPPQGCLEFGQICTLDDLCCNDIPCTGPQDGGTMRCRNP